MCREPPVLSSGPCCPPGGAGAWSEYRTIQRGGVLIQCIMLGVVGGGIQVQYVGAGVV